MHGSPAPSGRGTARDVPARTLDTADGGTVPLPDTGGRLTHLQFRRFAGCPVCHLHLRSFVTRHAEIEAAGIRELVVFHSTAAELRPYAGQLPFPLIPDPERVLYAEFGVETSRRALLAPRVGWAVLRGGARTTLAFARGKEPAPPAAPTGGRLGLPADFLITPDGRITASHHGTHADDQWPVDEVLARAAGAGE